jgi:hypothetical protein
MNLWPFRKTAPVAAATIPSPSVPATQPAIKEQAIMATAPVTPAPKVSWLKKLGNDFVKGFNWAFSAKGQTVITAGESIAIAVDPAIAPVVGVVNTWASSIYATEKKAATAASLGATATNAQKAVAATEAALPDVESDLAKAGLTFASSASAKVVNDSIVAIMNELVPAPATTTTTTTA